MNLPIIKLVEQLSTNKGSQCTFDDLKTELLKTTGEENINVYNIQLKEDDNLCLIYNVPLKETDNNQPRDQFVVDFEDSCRSLIIEKTTLKPIISQFNRILYNEESLEFLKDKDWSHVRVQRCYEGTLISVFNYPSCRLWV
jgi:hypothetical protein